MTVMLLVAHFLALGVAVMVFFWMICLQRRNRAAETLHDLRRRTVFRLRTAAVSSPCHLAGHSHARSRSRPRRRWPDRNEFFISPRVNGWVIVTGPGLPNPGDDVDACFVF